MNFLKDYTYSRRRPGYVYYLYDAVHDLCKIGLTEDFNKRLKGIQSNYPTPLTHSHFEVGNMPECENYLHRRFHLRRSHGEWFKGVTLEEFKLGLDEYLSRKLIQTRSSADFFKFMYDTEFEQIKGINCRFWKFLKVDIRYFGIFVQDSVVDEVYFNNMIGTIFSSTRSHVIIKHGGNRLVKEFCHRNRISCENFTYQTKKEDVLNGLKSQIMGCYGIVVVVKDLPNWFYGKIIDFAIKEGVKIRIIKSYDINKKTKLKPAK